MKKKRELFHKSKEFADRILVSLKFRNFRLYFGAVGYFCGFVLGWGLVGVWMAFPFGLTSAGLMLWLRFRYKTAR